MKNILFSAFALLLFAHAAAQEPDTNFVELPAQRTYNSKTYYNPEENLYLTRLSPGYMHYRTAEGTYRDIDTRLRRDSAGVFLPEGLYRARFANLTGQANDYDVTYEVARPVHEKFRSPRQPRPPTVRLQWKLLSFGYFDRLSYVYQILQNAEAAAPFVEGNQINYPQIFRGVTVRYTCGTNRLKEEIVFSQTAREALPDPAQLGLAADHTYLVFAAEFNLSPNHLNALAHRTGGRDPIRAGNGFAFEGESRIDFEDERENLYFFFPHDYAWAVNDSVSEPVQVRRIFYSQEGKNYLLIGVPWRWVKAAAPGPLLIDPTIYNDYATDTRLQSATNVGSEATLMVGKKSGQVKKRTIIKFDLQYSNIPGNATVLNAQLQLYYSTATVAGGSAWVNRWVQAHQLLNDWHELQADSLKRLTGVNWLAPRGKIGPGSNPANEDANGQFESTVLFQQGEHPTWKSWDLTNLTQKWINGTAANNGVILWASNEDVNAYDLRFYSSENETKPPELKIIWSDQPKTVYFLKDHLGSIRATVLDSAGAPVIAYDDYDPWGYILSGRTKKRTWNDNPAVAKNKFTGKEWDDEFGVNWLFFPARSYDPEIARWLVRDPLAMKYPSWSPYNYVLNNPVRLFDPDGKQVDVHQVRFFRDQALRSEGVDLAPFHQADAKVDLVGAGILAGGLAVGAAGPYITAGILANPLTVNKIGLGIAEVLAPGAEHLGVGQAVSAFKSFDFGGLAKKVGIEGIGGADLQRTVGGILAKSVKGSDLGTVLNALDEPLSSGGISMTGMKSMVGGKLIEFIPDGKGNVTITVRELGKDSSKLIGSSTVKASDLPFKDLGIDLSNSSLNKHFIGEVK